MAKDSESHIEPPTLEPALVRRERELLHALQRLAADRIDAERRCATSYADRNRAVEAALESSLQQISAKFQQDRESTEREYTLVRERVAARFESEHGAAEREFSDARESAVAELHAARDRAAKAFNESKWEAAAVLDAAKTELDAEHTEVKIWTDRRLQAARDIEDGTIRYLDECRQPREFDPPAEMPASATDLAELKSGLEQRVAAAEQLRDRLRRLLLPKLFIGSRLRGLFLLVLAIGIGTTIWLVDKRPFTLTVRNLTIIAALGAGPVFVCAALRAVLAWIARSQVRGVGQPLVQALSDCEALARQTMAAATAWMRERQAVLEAKADRDVQEADRRHSEAVAAAQAQHEQTTRAIDTRFPPLIEQIVARRDTDLADANQRFPARLQEIQQEYDNATAQARQTCANQLAESRAVHDQEWDALARKWWQGLAAAQAEIAEIHHETAALFLDWHRSSASEWAAPVEVPPAVRFGEFQIDMADIPDGMPQDERLRAPVPDSIRLPAMLPFPTGCSMLFKAAGAGRTRAVEHVQAVMLRFLASIPPGKVRFTIIDPVGLGENFAAFMHLADYDEQLVTNRIWTEPQHIDQRLTDLTEHMENVIQKYLRNEFETIEQYNAEAGEVAEPFRIVVVANFPANFTENTARRLVSIASSGARCGVYTLVSVDTALPMPHGFSLSDLEHESVTVQWQDGRFVWHDPEFGRFPLELDVPPRSSQLTDLLHLVGEKAREASRVEVPFEFIAPPPDRYWTADSRVGLNVPLGRAGATKTQNLRLGQGTSQHVLVAGKTGSGKSTLLHVLITNISLLYGPDDVHLYLVDFKKGVEFKTYAAYELPHARVVAIESEREFGLSVLQRLDLELKRRGDMFRDASVQDLGSYRLAHPSTPLPRILLVVDEFQEFFVEDDKIAQESALLLDRLVRQGRAFGVHVQLGSQTLGGAYSLARSTLGQMAVRIALQCSESDAHLILSDENTAARLLTRPGEAIYNDANGLIEGNNFFQIVWLSDDRREEYLKRIRDLAERRRYRPAQPQIVFEGNVPSDVRKNHLLRQLLAAPTWQRSVPAPTAWLGEAVAIKDATAAVFRPQVGSNLLMVGQQDEAALSIMLCAMVGLAAQHDPADNGNGAASGARFYMLDGSTADARYAGILDKVSNVLPHALHVVGARDAAGTVAAIAEELERRQKGPSADGPTIYLFLFDLQRFRDLRKQEDDFGFSRRGEEKPSPAKQLGMILREGPVVRIHTLIWCDSLNNLNRTFERQTIREFELRVLFQMSPGDSSTLIDSPAAGKLGVHRALFYSEELGQAEKFRPYGLPTDDWLAWVRDQMNRRAVEAGGRVPSAG